MTRPELNFSDLRSEIIGGDSSFETAFGQRLLTYCDYTASGRSLLFIESYILKLQRIYANTHTEDDITGRNMIKLLHQAEQIIKDSCNAGPDGRLISVGTGSTGAIWKFQQLVGIALPPATRYLLFSLLSDYQGEAFVDNMQAYLNSHRPVIFVGPYEHHSNEVTWREGCATVIETKITSDGSIDLNHLEQLLKDSRYLNRLRIGSFSAASNVTGMVSPVHQIARLLHEHQALACFDYAASAPYVKIDMNPTDDPDASLDAIFISPHKFLGGPGSSGVLLFKKGIYRSELNPSVGAGGTVDYVSQEKHVFITDIEEREKPGTPGVLQTMKAALSFQLKDTIGLEKINHREKELIHRVFDHWKQNENIEILGNLDPLKRLAIVSFNIKTPCGKYLHPKFVTTLLNDLFGIQSRAGCSCAGPYGHHLLGIDKETSDKYQSWVLKGYQGIKPGWCRIGFHYVMDDAEVNFVIEAVEFIAKKGYLFLPLYHFDINTGLWSHKVVVDLKDHFSLDNALKETPLERTALNETIREAVYQNYLNQAEVLAMELLNEQKPQQVLTGGLKELQFFSLLKGSCLS